MSHFIEYVCRGVVRSEDAIKRLNKSVIKLAKCNNRLCTSVICLGIAGLLTTTILMAQDKKIKALKRQVANLAKDADADHVTVNNTVNTTEGQTEQKGA